MKTPILRWVAVQLAMVGLANAQVNDPWVGKRVFTQYGAVLKVGKAVVDDEGRSASLTASGHDRRSVRVYRVERTKGEWLWLKDEKSGTSGWVKSDFVIPYEQAIEFFTNQLRSNPQASRFCARAAIWDEKGEYDIAIADYNEAIRLDPGEALYYSNRGNSWLNKHETDKAIADYNEAIRLDPKFDSAYSGRAGAWVHKKQYERAIADFDEAIRLDPKDASTYRGRGRTRRLRKEYEGAIADYNEAIRLDPKYAWAYDGRGCCWFKKREYDRAIADFREAIRLDAKYGWIYGEWALLLATSPDDERRDGKKAVEYATRACEMSDWKEVYHIDALAAAYAEAGDFEKAVQWQEKANKLRPDIEDRQTGEARIALYKNKMPYRDEE